MNKKILSVLTFTAALGVSGVADAGLIDRGHGLIYDDVLNITWLQDANYAQTSGYDTDGLMNWTAATAWAAQLVYGGYDDWRLPMIVDTGRSGCNFAYNSTDCGYNVDTSASELAYMFHVNLGNLSASTSNGSFRSGFSGTDWGMVNTQFVDAETGQTVSFQNFQNFVYWSGAEYALNSAFAWYFYAYYGMQYASFKDYEYYAWAVRSGDVAAAPAIPEPGSFTLLGLGVITLGVARRRRG